jgi:ferredoxin
MSAALPCGCYVRIDKPELQAAIDRLRQLGYRVVGPTVSQGAVVYSDLESIRQLPVGFVDEQQAGRYRLVRTDADTWFGYVVGPHSLKNFLFPPHVTLLQTLRLKDSYRMTAPAVAERPLAFVGARACELHALRVQDRVLLGGPHPDPDYQARRAGLFVLAVNCGRPAATCFCSSMGTGPAVTEGADVSLFELPGHFVLEVCSERGGEVLADLRWRPCTTREVADAQQVPRQAERLIRRTMPAAGLHDLLMNNLEHPRWDEVAKRCLACANCTMVCPTCFCSTVEEVSDLAGEHCSRERLWASCFTDDHSYMNSGTIRRSIASRYRQWATHKLATWIDQFGTSGCVGCGRCITWCPAAIDLTEEVAALRGGAS